MMNRNAAHFAEEEYQTLEVLLIDLLTVTSELKVIRRDELLVNTEELEFIAARLSFLGRGALDHVKTLKVIPHQTISDPENRHLRAVEDS